MPIRIVNDTEYTNLLLWRTEKDSFRVIQDGEYSAVLSNGNYTLIKKKYEDIFLRAKDQLKIQPVKIHDYQFNTIVEEYIELNFINTLSPEFIHYEEESGYKAWGYDGFILVSQELKTELEKIAGNELRFSPAMPFLGA